MRQRRVSIERGSAPSPQELVRGAGTFSLAWLEHRGFEARENRTASARARPPRNGPRDRSERLQRLRGDTTACRTINRSAKGTASGRERVCEYGWRSVAAGCRKKN